MESHHVLGSFANERTDRVSRQKRTPRTPRSSACRVPHSGGTDNEMQKFASKHMNAFECPGGIARNRNNPTVRAFPMFVFYVSSFFRNPLSDASFCAESSPHVFVRIRARPEERQTDFIVRPVKLPCPRAFSDDTTWKNQNSAQPRIAPELARFVRARLLERR